MPKKHNTANFLAQGRHDIMLLGQRGDCSLEYSDMLHFSIISNGLSIEEERIENLLGVLTYQFEPQNHMGGGVKCGNVQSSYQALQYILIKLT